MSRVRIGIWHAGRAELAKRGRLLRALVREEQSRQQGALVQGISLETYLDRILARDEFVLLEVDGQLCGFCAFYIQDLTLDSAFITLLLLSPEVRGHGLCRHIVACVAEVARHRGFDYLTLWGRQDSGDTLRLYQRMGFHALASNEGGQVFMRMAIPEIAPGSVTPVPLPAVSRGPTLNWGPAVSRGPESSWGSAVSRGPELSWGPAVS